MRLTPILLAVLFLNPDMARSEINAIYCGWQGIPPKTSLDKVQPREKLKAPIVGMKEAELSRSDVTIPVIINNRREFEPQELQDGRSQAFHGTTRENEVAVKRMLHNNCSPGLERCKDFWANGEACLLRFQTLDCTEVILILDKELKAQIKPANFSQSCNSLKSAATEWIEKAPKPESGNRRIQIEFYPETPGEH